MSGRGRRAAPDHGLAAHLRSTLWGPAEFVGVPGAGILSHGLAVGLLGGVLVTGAGAMGMWTGPVFLRSGEAGLVLVVALVLYLTALRAGRILVGLVGVLGVCLAFAAPQTAAGLAMAGRGQVQSAHVTSVESSGHHQRRFLCEVDPDGPGVSPRTKIWRGCTGSTDPGDVLKVLYDPTGRVPVRGMAQPGEQTASEVRLAALALMFTGGTTLAVVRSFRFTLP